MIRIKVNDSDVVKLSDAQAYAIHCILLDYLNSHKMAYNDEVDICSLVNTIYEETYNLTEKDREEIHKAIQSYSPRETTKDY